MKRVLALLKSAKSYISEYEQKNPTESGVAQKVIGGLLIADGLVGLENPLNGRKTRAGMLSSLFGFAMMVIFFFAGQFIINSVFVKADSSTTGTVVSVGRPVYQTTGARTGNNTATCSLVVEYAVNGKSYTGSPGDSSSVYCNEWAGAKVDVKYSSATPQSFTVGNMEEIFSKVFFYVPIFLGAVMLLTFFVRLATFVFGIILYRRGRRILKESPISDGRTFVEHAEVIKNDFLKMFYNSRGSATRRFGFSYNGNNSNYNNSQSGKLQGLGQLLGAANDTFGNRNNGSEQQQDRQLSYMDQPPQQSYPYEKEEDRNPRQYSPQTPRSLPTRPSQVQRPLPTLPIRPVRPQYKNPFEDE